MNNRRLFVARVLEQHGILNAVEVALVPFSHPLVQHMREGKTKWERAFSTFNGGESVLVDSKYCAMQRPGTVGQPFQVVQHVPVVSQHDFCSAMPGAGVMHCSLPECHPQSQEPHPSLQLPPVPDFPMGLKPVSAPSEIATANKDATAKEIATPNATAREIASSKRSATAKEIATSNATAKEIAAAEKELTRTATCDDPRAPGDATTASFNFTIRRADGVPLGLVVGEDPSGSRLTVESILPGGAIAAWNRLVNASRAVQSGDRIIAVNGLEAPDRILKECCEAMVLRLTMCRTEPRILYDSI
eukprot:gnl/TRDRNA2_/TRDRNA2_204792_c0_seq1.p1 gnl/TRDRNA2_/TRDRNA2_204792_c0~~gnl/TRDRNA2_/TRDRNA2_204792_c0_seq1.p1  ORF type:complete len:303 (+),score=50.89 gnl/TRDRNA2_/TRDRNA2_204792_c0_seq1:2-910(+)